MAIQILDGKGSGSIAEVKNNKLLVSAVVSSQEHYANHNQGKGFSVSFETTPTSGDCIFYLKNTDSELALSIEGFTIYMESDDYFDFKINNTGTPANGNIFTPINLNTSSGNLADCTCQYGSNITGLTNGNRILRYYKENNTKSEYFNFDMDIILGANGIFTIWSGLDPQPLSITINFNFHGTNN